MSELVKLNNSTKLIVCFGGMALKMGGIPPFEFLNYLSNIYTNEYDLIFYIDKAQCWYHKGIDGITTNIDDTKIYLDDKIKKYNKVIFMGVSAGGYASILFGSLCKVHNVVSFIPRTKLINPINDTYRDLKTVINATTQYLIYGDTNISDINDNHHISQCENLDSFTNVKIERYDGVNMKRLRDIGKIKHILDSL